MNKLENKIHELANIIFEDINRGLLEHENIGLFSGRMGIVIFCKHYLRTYSDDVKEKILERYIDSYFELLTSGINMFTYCSGMAGALEGIRYLNDEKLLDVDYSDVENKYKEYLCEFSLQNIQHGYYDYLHGGLGIVKYFLDDADFVNRALDALERTAVKDGVGYKWISRLGIDKKQGFNIALSHGMASIVSVLCLLKSPGVDIDKRDRLIIDTCNYILSQKIDPKRYGSCFPTHSLDNDPDVPISRSRMAWCYGDLGVATALWQAGKLMHRRDWIDTALDVFNFSARRRNLDECAIRDAGLCHGAASICMMFHYMFLETGCKLFAETRDYWLDCTLKMGDRNIGLGGYRAWHGGKPEWTSEYGMLEGIAGIGLLFLTLLVNPRDVKWMSFFMLN